MSSFILRFFLFISVSGLLFGAQPDLPPQEPPYCLIDGAVKGTAGKSANDVIMPIISRLTLQDSKAAVHIDYPFDGSVFPPDIVAPTFLWHDAHEEADVWLVQVWFERSEQAIYVLTSAEQPEPRIDPRAVSSTNKDYKRPNYDITARAWTPDPQCWKSMKKHSLHHPATVHIYGFNSENLTRVLSAGQMTLRTSRDPVDAPIFYRDVPLMPSATGKGIKPLAPDALELIAWRLRDISEETAPVVLESMPTCANCHSFSQDGTVLGMDLDGPQGDKGAYVLKTVEPQMVIEEDDIITWNSYKDTPEGHMNFGLFSQVSPDGRYVVSTLNEATYVENYKDFSFLQSFYPTRGILVVYDRETGEMTPLPGASSTNYVHTNATWTPDGKQLIFSRAPAKDKYDQEEKSEFAGDDRETDIQYNLYRIPFNDGKGGVAVPVKGASHNGMSNSFPKISPDGKWIVFVKSQKGQLLRPDSKLYMVPSGGGEARKMNCNLNLMNSWHSWSPNGKWMVFSSKGFRPFTQMFLTHIDDQGMDTPAILIPNSTADNRAVNIPEFLNGSGNSIDTISSPTQRAYQLFKESMILGERAQLAEALDKLNESISINPHYSQAHHFKGKILMVKKRYQEAQTCFEKALEIDPDNEEFHYDLATAIEARSLDEAIAYYKKTLLDYPHFLQLRRCLIRIYFSQNKQSACMEECRKILEFEPNDIPPRLFLGTFLFRQKQFKQGITEFETVLKLDPDNVHALIYISWALATDTESSSSQKVTSVELAVRAIGLSDNNNAEVLDVLAIAYASTGSFDKAITHAAQAQKRCTGNNLDLKNNIDKQLNCFQSGQAWTERERLPGMIYSSFKNP